MPLISWKFLYDVRYVSQLLETMVDDEDTRVGLEKWQMDLMSDIDKRVEEKMKALEEKLEENRKARDEQFGEIKKGADEMFMQR